MIMEVMPVSPQMSSQDGQSQTFYYRSPRRTALSFGAMLADEEEKLATAGVPRADEFRAPEPVESHYAMSEQELEESLQKLLAYAGLNGLE